MRKIFKYEVIYTGRGKSIEATWFFHSMDEAKEQEERWNNDAIRRGSTSRVKILSEKEMK